MTQSSAQREQPDASGMLGAPGMTTEGATEIYEQLLALADRIGAAYVNAFQKITIGIGDAQSGLVSADPSAWLKGIPSLLASAAGGDPAGGPADRAIQLSDALLDMSTRIGLAYVDAHEQIARTFASTAHEIAD
jgi:hypothetical protein